MKRDDAGTDVYYMTQLPSDSKYQYYYESDSNGTYYALYARLENSKDGTIPKDDDNAPLVYKRIDGATTNCGSSGSSYKCNYVITSNNKTAPDTETEL